MNKDIANPKIEILPEHIIDQIKAGEVLERPASLVKELIENSLDAKSSEINIHLIENGLDLLAIEDNGHGMSFDNLPYAFLRHATSKLKTYDDLYRLRSFGFRGEALASVAASARVTCTTQPTDLSAEGGKIIIHGGAQELLIPNRASTHGTSLYIKDLFYNTPARLKFIKSKTSEKSALKKMLYAFVLSNHAINFSIKWDEKEREIFKAVDEAEVSKRVEQVFFNKVSKGESASIWNAKENYDNYFVEVYFTPTTHTTPQYRHHYLFANNRFFQDKSLHQALLRTLDPLWRFGESGHYMVKITAPPEDLDVNVHPNKTQIKFLKPDVIYSLLVSALRQAMKGHSSKEGANAPVQKQEPFFSREENQTLDLLNMTSVGETGQNFSSATYFKNETSLFLTSQSPLLGYISPGLLLLTYDEKFFVGDLKKIMAFYLSSALMRFKNSDEVAGPLLISEPFRIPKGKIDSHFEDLKDLGLEIDRLNADVVALRTLPRFVPQALIRDLTQMLIQYFSRANVNQFDETSFKDFVQENWPVSMHMPNHLLTQVLDQKNILDLELLVLLSEKNVKVLLK